MAEDRALVITTINHPTSAVKSIVDHCDGWEIIIVGDSKTPGDWHQDGAQFFSVSEQQDFGSVLARECPFNHYARKNLGYLKAIADGAKTIAETDDDNLPYDSFLRSVDKNVRGQLVLKRGWENVYAHFSDARIWPRGFPLELVNESLENIGALSEETVFDCPIQQHLADGDPDVDAVYRLTARGEIKFKSGSVILSAGTFCPFNSQNTVWWPEVYPLLYLPSTVSFRMTDIWRSFVAQTCLYRLGKSLAFGKATAFQERNRHSLIHDFEDEIPGYLNNARIVELLGGLSLAEDPGLVGDNMRACYEKLVECDIVPKKELRLVDLWLRDLHDSGFRGSTRARAKA